MCKLTLPCLKKDWWRTTRWGDKCEQGEKEKEQLAVTVALCIPLWAGLLLENTENCLVYPVQLLLILTSTHSNQNNHFFLCVWGLCLLLIHDPNMSKVLLHWKANLLAEFNFCMFVLYSFCPDLLVYNWKQSALGGSKHVFRFKEYRLRFF